MKITIVAECTVTCKLIDGLEKIPFVLVSIMKLFVLLIICSISLYVSSLEIHNEDQRVKSLFNEFIQKYNRKYETQSELQFRFQNFKSNLQFIEDHNSKSDITFTVSINNFGDWSREEYLDFATDYEPLPNHVQTIQDTFPAPIPAAWDWRTKGAVTAIKNQGQCGSSPYFSAIVSVEGCHFISTGSLLGLSEEQVLDCSGNFGNQGCDGGEMYSSLQYIMHQGGVDSELCYPYVAYQGEGGNCSYKGSCCASKVNTYFNVTTGDEQALKAAVYKVPAGSAMDASLQSFEFYAGGVYSDPECSSSQIDHGIGIVGYGHNDTANMDFWVMKNTWGTDWGVEGYMYLARNDNNMCGVATDVSYAIGCPDC